MSNRPPAFRLAHRQARLAAMTAVMEAPEGWFVRIVPPTRSLDQNAKFHAAVADIAKAMPEWNGQKMTEDDWKALLVVSHAIATRGEAPRIVPDLENSGYVQLRESTASMSVARSSSLIDYTVAWATAKGIKLKEGER